MSPNANDYPVAASDVDYRFRTDGNSGASFGSAEETGHLLRVTFLSNCTK